MRLKKISLIMSLFFFTLSFVFAFTLDSNEAEATVRKHYAIDCETWWGTHCSGEGDGCDPMGCDERGGGENEFTHAY